MPGNDVETPLVGGGEQPQRLTVGQMISQFVSVLGMSALLGFFIGYAAKKSVTSVLLVIIAVVVITQVASCYGLATINWGHIKVCCRNCLDQDKDGKIDCKDCRLLCGKMAKFGVAAAIGGIGGFVFAWYMVMKLDM